VVDYRQALTNFSRHFSNRDGSPAVTDNVGFVPVITIPLSVAVEQVEPGVFVSAALGVGDNPVFTWPAVPFDERHTYENITLSRPAGSNAKRIALNIVGRQGSQSYSRTVSLIDTLNTGDRWNALGSRNAVNGRQYQSPGPITLYPGEQLVVHWLSSADAGDIMRVDYLLRIEAPPFLFTLNNRAVVTTV